MFAQSGSTVSCTVVRGTTYYAYPECYQNTYEVPVEVFRAGTTYEYIPSEEPMSSSSSDYESSDSGSAAESLLENFQNLSEEEVHAILMGWRLTAEQRNINGYPGLGGSRGRLVAVVPPTVYTNGKNMWIDESDPERQCCRCSEVFRVGRNGDFPAGEAICIYNSKGERKIADCHITAQKFATELLQFVFAPSPSGRNDERSRKVYALDAEMVATTAGPALARLSLVDMSGALVLDVIVKPEHKIVDPLTEFSGLTVEMVENAEHTIETAQQMLFELINSETILVGHSLESDLKALRLVHWNTVDTAILYADEYGNKIALKDLSKEYLGRKIQSDNEDREGHCSHEDALASLDLVKFMLNYGTL